MVKVLFVCIHNSGRSQIAEELLRYKLGDTVHVESAGLEPGTLNPVVVDVLKSIGVDISGKTTKSVFDMIKKNVHFSYVITVCDETNSERCPIFPGISQRLHWSFPDPSSFEGSYKEKYAQTYALMELIGNKIDEFVASMDLNPPDNVHHPTKSDNRW